MKFLPSLRLGCHGTEHCRDSPEFSDSVYPKVNSAQSFLSTKLMADSSLRRLEAMKRHWLPEGKKPGNRF